MSNRFRYRAVAISGRLQRGTMNAATANEAECFLRQRGLQPISVTPEHQQQRRSSVPLDELALVFRSLSSLRTAGVPLDQAIRSTCPIASPRLRGVLDQASVAIAAGKSFTESLETGRGEVPALVLGMVRAGERSGHLNLALSQAADQLEYEAELRSRLRQALAYPLLLAFSGALSVTVIVGVVVPRFSVLLGDFGQELPPATQALVTLSDWLQRWWMLLAGLTGVILSSVWPMAQTPAGQRALDRLILGLPVLGRMAHAIASARFLRALSAAIGSGMPLLPSMSAAGEATGQHEMRHRLELAKAAIEAGRPLSESLRGARALSPLAMELLTVGEATGQLGAMAGRASTLLAADAERQLSLAVRLLEPGLIVLFGGITAFIAGALLQAVYSLRPVS